MLSVLQTALQAAGTTSAGSSRRMPVGARYPARRKDWRSALATSARRALGGRCHRRAPGGHGCGGAPQVRTAPDFDERDGLAYGGVSSLACLCFIPRWRWGAQPEHPPWRVLFLRGTALFSSSDMIYDLAMRDVITSATDRVVEFYGEPLDVVRFAGTDFEQELMEFREKYRQPLARSDRSRGPWRAGFCRPQSRCPLAGNAGRLLQRSRGVARRQTPPARFHRLDPGVGPCRDDRPRAAYAARSAAHRGGRREEHIRQ